MDDLTTLLLIAIICVGIGIALGSLVTNAMNARQKESKPEEKKTPGLAESARIYRDTRSGSVVLEVKGRKYRKSGDLDAAGRALIEQQLAILQAWVGPTGQAQVGPSVKSKSAAGTSDQGEPDLSSRLASALPEPGPDSESSPEASVGRHPDLDSSPEPSGGRRSAEESSKQSYNPLDVFARALQSDVRKPAAPKSSIAAQIDEILQEKLAGLPDEKRAIRLMELPGKGMVVMVGLDQYDSVEAVPDSEVRALIRLCVAEWEHRLDYQE